MPVQGEGDWLSITDLMQSQRGHAAAERGHGHVPGRGQEEETGQAGQALPPATEVEVQALGMELQA